MQSRLLAIAIFLISAVVAVNSQQTQAFPDGPGKAETSAACTSCHAADIIVQKRASRADWSDVVAQMQDRGAQISDKDFQTIATYLAVHFGVTINVNRASAKQFMDGFSFTSAEANAMVKYRNDHGDFKSVDDLVKVPGVDTKKLQEQSANIVFQNPSPAAN